MRGNLKSLPIILSSPICLVFAASPHSVPSHHHLGLFSWLVLPRVSVHLGTSADLAVFTSTVTALSPLQRWQLLALSVCMWLYQGALLFSLLPNSCLLTFLVCSGCPQWEQALGGWGEPAWDEPTWDEAVLIHIWCSQQQCTRYMSVLLTAMEPVSWF